MSIIDYPVALVMGMRFNTLQQTREGEGRKLSAGVVYGHILKND